MKKDELRKEGLFITDFSNSFFEELTHNNEDLESYIQKIADKVNYLIEQGECKIWNCIFSELIKDLYPSRIKSVLGLVEAEQRYPEFYTLLSDFYTDPVFLTWDIAQKIMYNLNRLSDLGEYNLDEELDLEVLESCGADALISIGRQKYSKISGGEKTTRVDANKNKKYVKKSSEKDLRTELIPDLERLDKRYTEYRQKMIFPVYLPQNVKDSKIVLENDLISLNLLYSCNERFQRFLYHMDFDSNCYSMLKYQIEALNMYSDLPIHYIWEKMTSYNTICIMAKLIMELTIKEGLRTKKEKSTFIEYIIKDSLRYLFRQIRCMPNVLTRLLFLKIVFNYIMNKPREVVYDYLGETTKFLAFVNAPYQKLQESLLAMAVMVRWHIGKKHNRINWLSELEKEYNIETFKIWILSLNITADLTNQSMFFDEAKSDSLTKVENWILYREYRAENKIENLIKIENLNKIENLIKFVRKSRLLEKVKEKKYILYSKELANDLQKDGWISIDSIIERASEQDEYCYEEALWGKIFAETYSDEELKEGTIVIWDDCIDNIEKAIKPWLLSEYDKVIFENIIIDEDRILEIILKSLLYHFFK